MSEARPNGHMSARQARRRWETIVQRAGPEERFDRWQIYLPERIARKRDHLPIAATPTEQKELAAIVPPFKQPGAPTPAERDMVWQGACEYLKQKVAEGKKPKRVKRALVRFLFKHAKYLSEATDLENFRRVFNRNLGHWQNGGEVPSAFSDARLEVTPVRREMTAEESELARIARFECGGRVSQAYRLQCERNGEVTTAASKSYVPESLRRIVRPEVNRMAEIFIGPRNYKVNGGGWFLLNWSEVHARDWFQSDDCTLPVKFRIPDGKGWWRIIRGQWLPMIDVRSRCILTFVLIASESYDSLSIRTLMTKTCDEFGLPLRGFWFECGLWKRSQAITGGPDSKAPVSFTEIRHNIQNTGVLFLHADDPKEKVIEGVLGQFQNRLEGEPTYCGRDERRDCREEVRKAELAVNRHEAGAELFFPTLEQWEQRLHTICLDYNADKQEGVMLGGMSPNEAFQQLRKPNDPPVTFNPATRYLLSHIAKQVRVSDNGITLKWGKQTFVYRNAETGKRIGEHVLAWFNPETPELLSVTELNRTNPFTVERHIPLPAVFAPADLIKEEMAKLHAHQSHVRKVFRTLKAEHDTQRRIIIADRATAQLGEAIRQNEERAQVDLKAAATKARRVRNLASQADVPAALVNPNADDAEAGLEMLRQARLETEVNV